MEIREITTAIVQEIGKRDARIYELELQVEFLTKTLKNYRRSEEVIKNLSDEQKQALVKHELIHEFLNPSTHT